MGAGLGSQCGPFGTGCLAWGAQGVGMARRSWLASQGTRRPWVLLMQMAGMGPGVLGIAQQCG